ncbi:MAG TPA: hypothetical protein VKS81_10930 [Bacteroidota bacterium]|nr:hypothetical protein [Bacteroidota bacterium]
MKPIPNRSLKVARVLTIRKLHDPEPDYWEGKSVAERIAAMDMLRLQWYKIHNIKLGRIEKVYKISRRRTHK